MPTWKTSTVFVKRMISDAWGQDEVMPFIGNDEKIKSSIDALREELFNEGYIEIQNDHWKERDYEKIRQAAIERLKYLNDLDDE